MSPLKKGRGRGTRKHKHKLVQRHIKSAKNYEPKSALVEKRDEPYHERREALFTWRSSEFNANQELDGEVGEIELRWVSNGGYAAS